MRQGDTDLNSKLCRLYIWKYEQISIDLPGRSAFRYSNYMYIKTSINKSITEAVFTRREVSCKVEDPFVEFSFSVTIIYKIRGGILHNKSGV